jgi:putative SOS response-associated peptidase YedK
MDRRPAGWSARGFAFVWRRFELPDPPAPILTCVMVTVPANELIRRTVKAMETDPRMPAILEDDAWSAWLGEDNASPAAAKAVLKTMEGVNWQAAPEPKKPRFASPKTAITRAHRSQVPQSPPWSNLSCQFADPRQ